jgi:hypothetical protein
VGGWVGSKILCSILSASVAIMLKQNWCIIIFVEAPIAAGAELVQLKAFRKT